MEYPLVLVVADRIERVEQIVPIMELVKKQKKPLILFSMDLQDDPTSTMIYNIRKGIVQCCAVNVPWSAGIERDNLQDIATMTGATLVDNEHDILLKDFKLEHFGRAKTIKVTENETMIVGGNCDNDAYMERLESIRAQISAETSPHMKSIHQERLSRLNAKIAEIQVGG